MPSRSKKQQQYFGMIYAGKIKKPKGMTDQQVTDFAETKTKGLPSRVRTKSTNNGSRRTRGR